MIDLLEVEFKGNRKEIYSNPDEIPIKIGNKVIVQADKGKAIGKVATLGRRAALKDIDYEPKKVYHVATEEELHQFSEIQENEHAAIIVCKQKSANLQLKMKIVDTEIQFDRSKMTFFFTSDGRVDFRELVKQLAAKYKTRIELRQIGVRDEARRIDGCGKCGRDLCCSSFISEFEPITTQYAKDQNLPLNPGKLSGVCGRLMCCLSYEREFYQKSLKKFPTIDSQLKYKNYKGSVIKVDVFEEMITLRTTQDEYIDIQLKDLKPHRQN